MMSRKIKAWSAVIRKIIFFIAINFIFLKVSDKKSLWVKVTCLFISMYLCLSTSPSKHLQLDCFFCTTVWLSGFYFFFVFSGCLSGDRWNADLDWSVDAPPLKWSTTKMIHHQHNPLPKWSSIHMKWWKRIHSPGHLHAHYPGSYPRSMIPLRAA